MKHLSEVSDVEYLSSQKLYNYYQCVHCKLVFVSPMPYDRLQEIYPKSYYSFSDSSKKSSRIQVFLELIKRQFDKWFLRNCLTHISSDNLSCLDIGGGSGWMLNILKDADRRVSKTTVLDIDDKAKADATANGHKFILGVAEDIALKEEYDLILMLNLIEHVADPKLVLDRCFKALKPGGIVIIKTPNTDTLNFRLFKHSYWGGFHAPRHFNIFNKNNFTEICLANKFSVVMHKYTQGAPQWTHSIIGSFRMKFKNFKVPAHHTFIWSGLMALFAVVDTIRSPFFKTDQMFFVLKKF